MKVKSIRSDLKLIGTWISPDEVLTVLAIRSFKKVGSRYLVWSSLEEIPFWVDAKDFEIIDNSLCHNWIVSVDLFGFVEISLPPWLEPGFWERYHDDDEDSIVKFDKGRMLIESSANSQEQKC